MNMMMFIRFEGKGCTGLDEQYSDHLPVTQGAFAQGANIADWHIISEEAKDIKDLRESNKLAAKQFHILDDKVSEKVTPLFCGAQSGYNSLDPNGPAATRAARLPAGIRGLTAVEDDEVAFYAGKPTTVDEYRCMTLMGKSAASSPTSDASQNRPPTINTKDKTAADKTMWDCKECGGKNFPNMKIT
jgi:hypothetical protein